MRQQKPILDPLEIKVLIKCLQAPLSKRDITQKFKRTNKLIRNLAVKHLIELKFIEEKKLPKPETKKTPTYYYITSAGKKWINYYLKTIPT